MNEKVKEIVRKKIMDETIKEVTGCLPAKFVFAYWWIAQIIMLALKLTKVLTCSWSIIWLPLWSFLTAITLCFIIGLVISVQRILKFESKFED